MDYSYLKTFFYFLLTNDRLVLKSRTGRFRFMKLARVKCEVCNVFQNDKKPA